MMDPGLTACKENTLLNVIYSSPINLFFMISVVAYHVSGEDCINKEATKMMVGFIYG